MASGLDNCLQKMLKSPQTAPALMIEKKSEDLNVILILRRLKGPVEAFIFIYFFFFRGGGQSRDIFRGAVKKTPCNKNKKKNNAGRAIKEYYNPESQTELSRHGLN